MRLREGVVSDQDIAVLNTRFHANKWAAVEAMPSGGAYLATTRKNVAEVADRLIQNAIDSGKTVVRAWAVHKELHELHAQRMPNAARETLREQAGASQEASGSRQHRQSSQLPPDFANLSWDTELRRGLLRLEPDDVTTMDQQSKIGPSCIELVIGMKYLITQNIFQKINLVNG